MPAAAPVPTNATNVTRASPAGLGMQVAWATVGAVVGAVLWYLLSVPQHLINVVFAVFVGIGAGLGAGRLSGGVPRSVAGPAVAVTIGAVVLLVAQAVITRSYVTWAAGHLTGTPSDPSWEGTVGGLRLALDRAAARKGWAPNASYFYWTVSLLFAGSLAWFTAPSRRRTT